MGTLTYASAKNSFRSTLARSSDYMQYEGRNIAVTSIAANRNRNKFPKYGGRKGAIHKVKGTPSFGKKIPIGEHYIDKPTWRGLRFI
jgi:hypothetical protein